MSALQYVFLLQWLRVDVGESSNFALPLALSAWPPQKACKKIMPMQQRISKGVEPLKCPVRNHWSRNGVTTDLKAKRETNVRTTVCVSFTSMVLHRYVREQELRCCPSAKREARGASNNEHVETRGRISAERDAGMTERGCRRGFSRRNR